jgi:hypothetical protein
VGAENRDGSSGATIGPVNTVPDSDGYIVNMGNPTPGGSVTIWYDVKGRYVGNSSLKATMITDVVAGVTKIITPIKVTP